MIQANELGLENIVQDELGNIGVVKQINGERYMKYDGVEYIGSVGLYIHSLSGVHGRWIQKLKPIKLTEEILLKCGFDYNNNTSAVARKKIQYEDSDYPVTLQFTNNGKSMQVCRSGIGSACAPCEYLHQLQNLYLALTGKELEVKIC